MSEPAEDTERRPLSVRSFASAIQARRTVPEAARAEQPVPPPARPAPALPATEDRALDEALTRELDTGLGSLDWNPGGQDRPVRVAEDTSPQASSAERTPERRLTLEEEMSRLLGDFDFGEPRR